MAHRCELFNDLKLDSSQRAELFNGLDRSNKKWLHTDFQKQYVKPKVKEIKKSLRDLKTKLSGDPFSDEGGLKNSITKFSKSVAKISKQEGKREVLFLLGEINKLNFGVNHLNLELRKVKEDLKADKYEKVCKSLRKFEKQITELKDTLSNYWKKREKRPKWSEEHAISSNPPQLATKYRVLNEMLSCEGKDLPFGIEKLYAFFYHDFSDQYRALGDREANSLYIEELRQHVNKLINKHNFKNFDQIVDYVSRWKYEPTKTTSRKRNADLVQKGHE